MTSFVFEVYLWPLKDKSCVRMSNARKQTLQQLPRIMNFFPLFDVRNRCKLVRHSANLGGTSLQFRHHFSSKHDKVASIN